MLNLADFALQEQLEGNLMVAISRAWYYGSCAMAAKPIKSLELHYTMNQFLIIPVARVPKGEQFMFWVHGYSFFAFFLVVFFGRP